jgi:hypothetical protein
MHVTTVLCMDDYHELAMHMAERLPHMLLLLLVPAHTMGSCV